MWLSPNISDLRDAVGSSSGRLLVCSPYVSKGGLDAIVGALPSAVSRVEVWTKLDPHDWLTGASEPDALLDFIEQVGTGVDALQIRHSPRLHAKMLLSDGPVALAGSANLTLGGYGANLEVVRRVSGVELTELKTFAAGMRRRLIPVSLDQFEEFVAECLSKIESQEALLELIRAEMPPPDLGPMPIRPYLAFLEWLDARTSPLAVEVLAIARNLDRNNNTGKVKHAFYGVQRFLQEHPHHLSPSADLPEDDWLEVAGSPFESDWREFLEDHADEVNHAYGFSMATLRSYLTPSCGGIRTGGGGGDNELKRTWPFVGRFMVQE